MNYYNDNDPTKAAWLRQLVADGLIPDGYVDERGIEQVTAADLKPFTQHHFFAGIGGWAFALQLAGWPNSRRVATASCPCQPFSQSGLGLAEQDPRHLWPHVHRLNTEFKFPILFGEQVASPLGREWFARVRLDLETLGSVVGVSDLCAASVSAPHPRQRLYWVAYADQERQARQHPLLRPENQRWVGEEAVPEAAGCGAIVRMANSNGERCDGSRAGTESNRRTESKNGGHALRMGDADGAEGERFGFVRFPLESEQETIRPSFSTPWKDAEAIRGADGRARRIKRGLQPLANGLPGRVALLGGAGDAIVPQLAAEFIQASEEALRFEHFGI